MPDKEFDNLFRDKFEDAEIEPSANLWANIEKELEPKRKKTIPLYWMAAAAVTVSLSAMLLFQKEDVIKLQGPADPIAKVEQTLPVTPEANVADVSKVEATPEATVIARSATIQKLQVKKEAVQIDINKQQENIIAAVQPITNPERLPIKPMDAKPLDVMPIKEVVAVENPIAIASITPSVKDQIEENEPVHSERKGIKNVGDLVNFVVDKVDKREKKLVRFNTDEDDNSTLIGINIGFLKFNKKNK